MQNYLRQYDNFDVHWRSNRRARSWTI